MREVERLDRELSRATCDSERELESSRMWHSKFTSIKDDAHKKQAEMVSSTMPFSRLGGKLTATRAAGT